MKHFALGISLCAYLAIATIGIQGPAVRHDEEVLVEWAAMAHNQAHFGFRTTGFAAIDGYLPSLEPREFRQHLYPNRPILEVIVLALVFSTAGEGEMQIRMTLLAFGILSIVSFYLLACRLGPPRIANVATLIFVATPLFCYFSLVACHLALLMPMTLLAVYSYWRWYQGEGRRWLASAALFVFLGCQCDWPGYFVPMVLGIHCFLVCPTLRKRCLLIPIAAIAIFGLHLLLVWSWDTQYASGLRKLWFVFLERSSSAKHEEHLSDLMTRTPKELVLYLTAGCLLLAAVGLIPTLKRKEPSDLLILLLPLLAIDKVLFPAYAAAQEFLTFMLVPAVALLASRGLDFLLERNRIAKTLAISLSLVGLLQSAIVIHRRFTRPTPHLVFLHELAQAIRQETRPEDRILVLTLSNILYLGYYSDRYLMCYRAPLHDIQLGNTWSVIRDIDPEQLTPSLFARTGPIDFAVTAPAEAVMQSIPLVREHFANWSDPKLRIEEESRWQLALDNDPLESLLRQGSIQTHDRGAFRFYRLRRAP